VNQAIFADGFEEALVGVGERFNQHIAIYDFAKCVDILLERDKMGLEEALEHMEFNLTGAWVGNGTPIFINWRTLDEYKDFLYEAGEFN